MKLCGWMVAIVALISIGLLLYPSFAVAEQTSSENNPQNVSDADKPADTEEKIDEEFLDEDLDFLDEEEEQEQIQIADPLYYWNRGMYHINDTFYFWLLKPFAQVYKAFVTEPIRTGVSNFFTNLTTPIRLVNSVLQGKWKKVGIEVERFIINTTGGVLGFGNPAKTYHDLNPQDEDTDLTLGYYRIGYGFFIMWPVFGPSSLRGTVGMIGDYFLNPVSYVNPWTTRLAIRGFDRINKTSFRIGDYESFKEAAIDPYIAIRNAYIQNRTKKVDELLQ